MVGQKATGESGSPAWTSENTAPLGWGPSGSWAETSGSILCFVSLAQKPPSDQWADLERHLDVWPGFV